MDKIELDENTFHAIIMHTVCTALDISNKFHIENKSYDVTKTIYQLEEWALNFINKNKLE